jgi:hypothetical protein
MEPKKYLKKHTLTEPEWVWDIQGTDLINRINEISEQIHRNTTRGPSNWIIMGSTQADQFNELMNDTST